VKRARLVRGALVALAMCAGVDQLVQHTVLSDGELFGHRIAPFDPPIFTAQQQAVLDRMRAHVEHGAPLENADFDVELGWAPRRDGGSGEFRFDWAGARLVDEPLPHAKRAGVRRIVAVGCSFTLGDEVRATESWAARVDAARDDVEVANLGMGAYGIDQAHLRFLRDGVPLAPDEVWLGFLPSAAPRVVTMYLPAMRHFAWSPAFKPRYEFDMRGNMLLIPNPARTPKDFVRLLSGGERFHMDVAPHDHWVERASLAYAPRGTSWMHSFATTRAWLTYTERGGRDAREFLLDPTNDCTRIVDRIVRTMDDECRASHARFRLLVLPDRADLADREQRGKSYWSALSDGWRAQGIDVVDVTDDLESVHAAANDAFWAPSGHYSAEGNRAVAEAILRRTAGD